MDSRCSCRGCDRISGVERHYLVFSIYVDRFNGFSTYGSLTTIIILMLWLYACMYIVMVGAFLNRYFKPAFQFFVGKRKDR